MAEKIPCDDATLRSWMINYISSVLKLPGDAVPLDQTFDSFGFDSVEAVVMAGVMEEEFRVAIDPIQLFEHPTINDFVKAHAGESNATLSDFDVSS